MPNNDTWDWPVLLYVGTITLKRTERQFWKMTPRKLKALTDTHIDLNEGKQKDKGKNKARYIDQVF